MKVRRRLLAAALALPWGLSAAIARAQPKVWRIGLMHVGDDHVPPSYKPLLEGMRALGFEEGRNVRYDFRNAKDDPAAAAAAAAFVRDQVDLIIAFDHEACLAAHRATATLPIVMIHAANPVAGGFAKSLARPGLNMTGFAGRPELPAKEMEILKEIAPKWTRVLLLFDSRDPASLGQREDARMAAKRLGVTLLERDVPTDSASVAQVFARLKRGDAEAVLFASNPLRHRFQSQVFRLANELGMAIAASRKDVVEQGALFSYSYEFAKIGNAAASRYVAPVLRGTKPGDLPIEEVTEYELVVNRGTAKKLGLVVPSAVLLRAERVIE